MTISSTTNRAQYTGNGVTVAFPFAPQFFTNTDLIVTVTGVLMTLGTDYTVTGANNPAGGTVTFAVAPINASTVLIVRSVASTQGASFPNNTAFDGPTIEAAFDRVTVLAQQTADALSVAVINAAGVGTAASIANVPAGGIAAINVQAALNELDTEKAPLASPALTGTPTAPTPASTDNTTKIATTAFVGLATAIPYYIAGLQMVNNGATSMDVQTGACSDGNNTHMLLNAATFTKTQAAFAAGTGNGGKMSAAAMANNTFYYFYALRKDADGSIEFGFDVSPTAPTAQAGYTAANYRYIGARKTQLAATNWDTFIQHGDLVLWSTPPALDVSGAVTSANRTLTTVNIPAVKVEWLANAVAEATAGLNYSLLATDPACADVATNAITSTLGSLHISNTSAGTLRAGGQIRCWSNTSSQVGLRGSNSNNAFVQTIGWIDSRGKPT